MHAWDLLKEVFITSTIVWSQVNSREGTQLQPLTENWIKDLLSMALPDPVPPALQQATTDPCLPWRLADTHRQVCFSLPRGHRSLSWVLAHTSFHLCPPRVYFPVLCKLWQLCGGVNGDLCQEGLFRTQVGSTQSSSPVLTCTSTGDAKHSSVPDSVGSLDPGAHKACLSPLSISGRNGV